MIAIDARMFALIRGPGAAATPRRSAMNHARAPHRRTAGAGEHGHRSRALVLRRVVMPALCALAVVLIPVLIGAVNVGVKLAALPDATPEDFPGPFPEPPAHDPAKRTAVVLASDHGAEISDLLTTYEILARSQAVNVYAVAPERRLLPL